MLTPADMERVLENLDRRLSSIEQKLPTLATAGQLDGLALATSDQFEAMERTTAEQFKAMERTTAEQFKAMERATAEQLDGVKQFARALNEETNDRVRLVAEGLDDLTRRVDDLPTRQEFRALSDRVDDLGTAVSGIAKELSGVGRGVASLTMRLEQKGVI
jgi:hypothetical protein